jgi:hypothetical protein
VAAVLIYRYTSSSEGLGKNSRWLILDCKPTEIVKVLFRGETGVPGITVDSPLAFYRHTIPSNLTDLLVPKISRLDFSSYIISSFIVALSSINIPGSR